MKSGVLQLLRNGAVLGAFLCATLVLQPIAAAELHPTPPEISKFVSADAPPTFATAAEAIQAFKQRLAADDLDGLAGLLGLDPAKVKASEATMKTYARIREGVARQLTVTDLNDHVLLEIGRILWPFPFPVVKGDDGKWAFDTYAGLEEIENRRVGENELQAIATSRAYLEAQYIYASEDRDDDGVLEFAQKLVSTPGQHDGLYWPSLDPDDESPAGPFIVPAALDKTREGGGYFGYRFRVLRGQGDQIVGGKHDYVINGNMIAGYALIAWPVEYGTTGVYTFVTNHRGAVYQADLGPETAKIASGIKRFNPNEHWELVDE
ncbi:DUF2950 family protein [Breoghania sp.]|uniref:DUF2950 family protein n=1 Tax=Breoghania sp. TaxID=2065378 RepID=UPI002AA6378B|nr:DUF2950 family protein [Breoghania sp.]